MIAPSGARLPRRMAMPASGLNGSSKGVITSRFQHGASLTFSQMRLAVDGQRVLVQQPALAELAQHDRQAAGVVEVLHQEAARGHQVDEAVARRGRARSKSSSVSSTPTRPRDAPADARRRWSSRRWRASVRIAFSNASRVRIFDSARSSRDQLDDAPAGHARERVAARVHRRDGGVLGQRRRRAPRPSRPWSRPCPWSCSGRALRFIARFGLVELLAA